jgi:hypothetical protein
MVPKLLAALLVVLCVLPVTAPFATVGPSSSLAGHETVATIGTLSAHTSVTDSDDDDALAIERATFLRESRLCAEVAVSFFETAFSRAPFVTPGAPHAFTIDSPPLKTILRL